ncbi:3-hydroxyacyl-CoA dehydrogenase NAD-binding domain-containing protein [Bradyrhizobium yuanmingense]|uniref:3-hydroxyacyl-CoA dehydrogenase NAD-binding domain-containing protein n=1 Tax=Bradyrhizobium yuanmingense TaxID=108015 RepID=UPI0023B981A5|nr:3-hydroxyacyl-CoA dehydrogenase NAD-binding domain-containing protein [Bradyrhizobium yuanmingense]MDF0498875.1 3-hydroxyacyl-CoA dehydrogenase NAD-binding domain-containing protein [Bradyrhizobium yuanmingense]
MSENSMSMSERLPEAIGLLGGGVIGGGWAARFMLNGVNVRLYDPAPNAIELVRERLDKARRAFRKLTNVALPAEGLLTVVGSVAEAVRDVQIVQENAPEKLELKQKLLAEACQAAAPETLICSSTSCLRPSLLQAQMPRPERLLVAHPFQPVYLVPLVELCAGERTAPEALERAAAVYRAVGMYPLVVRKEIHGFIANRLQSAAWREALWLVHDGLATVKEIDDAVRYSFGLRRPVLGPISTHFVGSGATTMRGSIEKWGPGSKDLSKLEVVPDHTDAFLNMMSEQAEAQASAENMTISEYQQLLDDGIVGVLQGLRSQGCGAGETLAQWEESLRNRVPSTADQARVGGK